MSILRPDTQPAVPALHGLKYSLVCGLLAAVLAAIGSVFLPNYYRSESKILPADSKSSGGLGQLAAAAAAFGVGMPGSDAGDANFVEILASRSVQEAILNTEFQFQVRSWRFGPEQRHQETLYRYLGARNMDQAVRALGGMISIGKDARTKIITVSSETRSPELSQQIVHSATRYLETFVQSKGRTRGSEKARFAEARLKESREEMAEAEAIFRRFLDGNRNYQSSLDPTVRLAGTRLEAELKLRQQLVLTLAMNREQAMLEEKNDIPIVNILDEANLPIDKSRPKRASYVLFSFLGAALGVYAWLNREWIRVALANAEEPPEAPVVPKKESA